MDVSHHSLRALAPFECQSVNLSILPYWAYLTLPYTRDCRPGDVHWFFKFMCKSSSARPVRSCGSTHQFVLNYNIRQSRENNQHLCPVSYMKKRRWYDRKILDIHSSLLVHEKTRKKLRFPQHGHNWHLCMYVLMELRSVESSWEQNCPSFGGLKHSVRLLHHDISDKQETWWGGKLWCKTWCNMMAWPTCMKWWYKLAA